MDKLEAITEYFKKEAEGLKEDYERIVESAKSNYNNLNNITLLITAAFIMFSWYIDIIKNNKIFVLVGIGLILIVCFFAVLYEYFDYKKRERYLSKYSKLTGILKYLYYAKAIKIDDNAFTPLVERIKLDFRDPRLDIMKPKEYEIYQITRLDEYIRILDQINAGIGGHEIKDNIARQKTKSS